MIIGVDFDNTIVCYDKIFHKLAVEKGLIPEKIPEVKDEVRNYLRKQGKEDSWTELQGLVYGPEIIGADPFQGVIDFFLFCKENNIAIFIISHKTKHPFIGEKYNLHESAQKWLEKNGFYNKIGLKKENVFFELTKEEKLSRISKQKCTYYIDDLPEFLSDKNFPKNVKKILFDPNNNYKNKDLESAESWEELIEKIKTEYEFGKNVSDLGKKINFSSDFILKKIKGGKNNKVFLIKYNNGKKAFLKSYFQHPKDPRNRLKSEYSFLDFVWNNDIRCVPQPLGADFENNLGLYEFIDGKKLSLKDINEKRIDETINFFIEINKYKDNKETKELPIASEACFSLKNHFDLILKRVNRLKNMKKNSEINKEALEFIENELLNVFEKYLNKSIEYTNEHNLDINKEISEEEKCISPSDFGFHNALLKNGKLYFIDFEYAGIDDPAKMVCDFFCQPKIPVNMEYFKHFLEKISLKIKNPEDFKHRINALLPLYKIKWCCILLNDFLDVDLERRSFADVDIDIEKLKIEQLEKAKRYLEKFKF